MERPLTKNIDEKRGPLDLAGYEKAGGYAAVRKVLADMAPGEVTDLVKAADLKGRGGAGFPTGRMWQFVAQAECSPK